MCYLSKDSLYHYIGTENWEVRCHRFAESPRLEVSPLALSTRAFNSLY